MRRTAFTLLELLLVLAIIIIISGIGVASYQRQYERAKFKSCVLQIQIDLNRARLLSMQSGQAYIFRYAPGSGYYEIAPLRTLQETLYRISGDIGDEDDGLLGDALTSSGGYAPMGGGYSATSGVMGGSIAGSPNLLGMTQYTDDLFSAANISADLAEYARTNIHENQMIANAYESAYGGSSGGLGGSLNGASPTANSTLAGYGANGASSGGYANSSLGGASSIQGAGQTSGTLGGYGANSRTSTGYPDATLGGYGATATIPGAIDPATGLPVSPLGGAVAINGVSPFYSDVPPNSVRDLSIQEQPLAKENALAWRTNGDGLVVRKQLEGDSIFTFLRVSSGTRVNLNSKRPRGVKGSGAATDALDAEGENLGSTLGGSLRSVPKKSATSSSALGGGLDATPGQENARYDPTLMAQDEVVLQSVWSEPIVFYPDGKTSNAVLGFASTGKTTYYSEIALRGMTGVARISSISTLEPGENPATSALTQEQLFRLANPYYDMQTAQAQAQATGVATSGGTAGALGGALDGADPYGLGAQTGDMSGALGGMTNDPLMTGDMPTTPGVNYGSTERRTGYSFNESAPNAQDANVLGANMSGGALDMNMNAPGIGQQGLNQPVANAQNANSFGTNVSNGTSPGGVAAGVASDPFAAVDSALLQPSSGALEGGALGGDPNANSAGALGGSVDDAASNGADRQGRNAAAQGRRQTELNDMMNLGSGGAL